MNSTVKDILKYIQQCDSFHDNCDCLLDNNECDYLLDYINQLETNRDEVKEEIKDLLEHWKGNDLVERDLNILLTILEKVGGSNE